MNEKLEKQTHDKEQNTKDDGKSIDDKSISSSISTQYTSATMNETKGAKKRGNYPENFEKRKQLVQKREELDYEFHIQLQADNGESPLILLELGKKE